MLARIANRAGQGVWRNRGGVFFSALVVVGLAGYIAVTGIHPLALPTVGASTLANTDCADTAMAVIADKSSTAAASAYQCMDSSFRQRVSESEFLRQMQSQKLPNIQKLERVGDYHSAAGGTLVYYAVDGGAQSVGYIVYLGQDGKVLRIE
jgi:hypothetical protein